MFNKDQAIVTDFFRLILFRVNKKNYPKHKILPHPAIINPRPFFHFFPNIGLIAFFIIS